MSARVHFTKREMERQIVSSQNHENHAATLNGCCKPDPANSKAFSGDKNIKKKERPCLNQFPKKETVSSATTMAGFAKGEGHQYSD